MNRGLPPATSAKAPRAGGGSGPPLYSPRPDVFEDDLGPGEMVARVNAAVARWAGTQGYVKSGFQSKKGARRARNSGR